MPREFRDISVTDGRGKVIGSASLQIVPDGARIVIDILDGQGMTLVRTLSHELADGISIRPIIPPFEEPSRASS